MSGEISELILPINQDSSFKNDVGIPLSTKQSGGSATTQVAVGNRNPGWAGAGELWEGVWVEIDGRYAWLTADEATALSVAIMRAAKRLRNGEEM